MSVEEWLAALAQLESSLRLGGAVAEPSLSRLVGYYDHLAELAKGTEKDAIRLQESLRHLAGWREEVATLQTMLTQG